MKTSFAVLASLFAVAFAGTQELITCIFDDKPAFEKVPSPSISSRVVTDNEVVYPLLRGLDA